MSIQIGRKYVIVNSFAGNDGKIVTVTGYAGPPNFQGFSERTGARYYVDAEMATTWDFTTDHLGELQLKPIDDDDSQWESGSWEALKGIWTPSPAVTA
jgi:hypothetical protein